jgi:hypothetical protein
MDDSTIILFTAFTSISIYNDIEIILLVLDTVKKYTSLYFIFIIVGAFGNFLFSLGYVLAFIANVVDFKYTLIFMLPGWIMYISGVIGALCMRLKIIILNDRVIKYIQRIILSISIILFILTTIGVYGSNEPNPLSNNFARYYDVIEKIEIITFFIIETILSCLYIHFCWNIINNKTILLSKRIIRNTIIINVLLIAFDIIAIITEFTVGLLLQGAIRTCTYSIKLKAEFYFLYLLKNAIKSRVETTQMKNITT